jgi:hypothetical protein
LAFCCSVLGCVSPPIGEALASGTEKGCVSAHSVVLLAGVVAKVELCGVAGKVRFAHVVIGADHATLEDREEVFDRVAMLETAGGDVFLRAMVDLAVTAELAANAGVNGAFVGHEIG